jgi:dUTP pyrophosphatase
MEFSGNDFKKLMSFDLNSILTKDELTEVGDLLNLQISDDWVYNTEDNSYKLVFKIINDSRNPDPWYQKKGDSGFDLMADIPEGQEIVVNPLERELVPTGLRFQIPLGYEIQVRPRSGLALKHGIIVLNSPGTIDSGYTGEIKVIIYNTGKEPFIIKNGDRIAQAVLAPVQYSETTKFVKVNKLDHTDRGEGGFGSTGV